MIRFEGERSIAGNPIMPQYMVEDITARLLYESRQRLRTARPVDAEKLASFMGASLRAEYLSDKPYSLCAVALENQTLRTMGKAYVMLKNDIIIEKAIVDRCDKAWYSYAIFHALAHLYLHDESHSQSQLSFDLTGTQSEKHFLCDVSDLMDVYEDDRLDSRPACEGQADNFASCLMLPKVPFKTAAAKHMSQSKINRAGLKDAELDSLVCALSEAFAAPPIIVLLRLKKLLYL